MKIITEIFDEKLSQAPAAVALVDGGRTFTYRQLSLQSGRAAAQLSKKNIGKGAAVLVFVPVSIELYACLLALFRLGAVAVLIDPAAGRKHIERCCEQHHIDAFIGPPKAHLLRLVSPAIRKISTNFVSNGWLPGTERLFCSEQSHIVASVPSPTDPALITFTSGSTGQPKAAVRSHQFLIAQHQVLEQSIELEATEVDLTTLPVFVLANLASGVTSVLPAADLRKPGRIKPDPVLKQIRRDAVTRSAGSPAFYARLLTGNPALVTNLRSIRKLYTGGAPVFPNFLDRLHLAMPESRLVAVYGSTEAEPIAHIEYSQISQTMRARMKHGGGLIAGFPVPEIELRIISDRWGEPLGPYSIAKFQSLCLPSGQQGEIVVSGGHVLPGYLHGLGNEESKIEVAGSTWHRTGDAGYLDAAGRLWLLGRCAAKLGCGNDAVYPFAVEVAVSEFPYITRSAFVSVRQQRVLVVESVKHLPNEILLELKTKIAPVTIDKIVQFDCIPVDSRHNAKVNYPELRKLLESGLPSDKLT